MALSSSLHKVRIEVEKSIEENLTDIQSSEIIRENIFPHWKKGNLYAELSEAVDVISHMNVSLL